MATTDEDAPQAVIYLGNRKAIESITTYADDGDGNVTASTERRPAPGKRFTTVQIPAGMPLMEAVNAITSPLGVWRQNSDADSPAWVASTDPAIAQVLASHWQCEVRDPEPEEG